MKRISIAEGINLCIIESDKFKTNYMKVCFPLELKKETVSYAALLAQVLMRGSKNHPTMTDINRALEYLYASAVGSGVGKIGEKELVIFNASFLRNEFLPDSTDLLSEVCKMLSEIIFSPNFEDGKFKSEYVESEKKNLCDAIRAEINNKGAYANKRLFEIMCEGEPYSVSAKGDVESVSEIDSASLKSFYDNEFSNAPIEIFFVGRCNEEELSDLVRTNFGKHARKTAAFPKTVVKENVEKVKRVREQMPVNQGKLAIGFRTSACTDKKNTEQFVVFNEIFGASPTSKLFENVREKLSLCYYCSSKFIAQKGIMNIASGVKVGNEKLAEEEIMNQLSEMQKGNFSENDITEAKKSLENGYKGNFDDPERLATFYLSRILSGEENASVEQVIEKINAVTRSEIIEMANTVVLDTVYFLEGTNTDDDEDAMDEE